MQQNSLKPIYRRIFIIKLFFGLFFLIIGLKAIHLQIYQGAWLSEKASKQYIKHISSPAKRGNIYDRNYGEIAVTINTYSVFAHPLKIKDVSKAARYVSNILDINFKKVKKKLCSGKKFVWIKRDIRPDQAKKIKNIKMSGLHITQEPGRVYPNRVLAAQVTGFTGIDGNGLEGLEFYYNKYLNDSPAPFTIVKDAFGRSFTPLELTDRKSGGHHLVLTLDLTIQHFTEKTLEKIVAEFSAKSAIAIVMIPHTGEILALAHVPSFNPNKFQNFNPVFWRNRAITDFFEPGSTMKIFLAAAALESGKCDINTLFFCENGAYRIGRKVIHDTHEHEWLSLQQVIKYSSNIGAIKMGEYIGAEYFYKTLRGFGFGQKTGIDCPSETSGILSYFKKWRALDRGAISFGHGISVSAIQLISAASAIANDGTLMKPCLVHSILDSQGNIIRKFSPQKVRQVISKKTASIIREVMQTVIEPGGTGVEAALERYTVCGKTGTSKKLKKGKYDTDRYIASFVGFAPAEKPKIAVLVVVDEPKNNYYGGKVAAPAFKSIARDTLYYLRTVPDKKAKDPTASSFNFF
ncbi:cell division protein FtsI (penicillin-binding protein 3) [Candidatus Magnetomoraceae bacterium gMMP-15]